MNSIFVAFAVVLIAIIVGGVVLILIVDQDPVVVPEGEFSGEIEIPYDNVTYNLVEIEGMNCLIADGLEKFAITCDWDRRN